MNKSGSVTDRFAAIYFLIFVAFVLIATGRWANIYIEHDDWDFMIRPEFSLYATPWGKTLSEGRWINYLWSLFAIYVPARTLFVIFITGYATLCWVLSSCLNRDSIRKFLVAAAIFVCPVYSFFSTWPATLSPSVWISSALVYFLFAKRDRLISYALLSFTLSLTYPPLGLVCLVFLQGDSSNCKQTFKACCVYFFGFVAGVATIYALNYYYHGHLGLVPEGWRNYHAISNYQDAVFNFKKTLKTLVFFWDTFDFALIITAICLIIGAIRRSPHAIPFCLVFLFCFGLDFALVFYTGMDVSDRNFIWPWFMAVASVCIFLLNDRPYKFCEIIAFALLIITLFVGFKHWVLDSNYFNKVNQYVELIGTEIDSQKSTRVGLCGETKYVHVFTIQMMVKKKYDIDTYLATQVECANINAPGLTTVDGASYYRFR
ncbi:TPA: hypothetical protein J5F99_004069 [Escherichia coli]|nr:hypothetical protein [Escherichia coli]